MKDLIVLVADSQQEAVINTLLEERYRSLGIRQLQKQQNFAIYAHPNRDPGVYGEASQFLSLYINQFTYALVLLDAEWKGSPGASQIKEKVQTSLNQNGWENRSATIVIEPELEIWVWSSSDEVPNVLGKSWDEIRNIAQQKKYWQQEAVKPHRPKELMEEVLRQARKHPSADLFINLAKKVSLVRCEDAAFQELKERLQEWFPP
ncbi:methylation-associated defense system protein MAD4 [Aerosakkonema funiforme]|uniref:DUF4276 family protein n=1 Tax=Aerosakkonema funiforme FACHB-1375 TaxID=2949571 RepID=A0A926ZI60_9CYAN|nr:hypothetical protein [Aerosakkonema funiforme]MBD2183354.1 hypothetical protein [Aerosakkonema funiforme FACHB-1375]